MYLIILESLINSTEMYKKKEIEAYRMKLKTAGF